MTIKFLVDGDYAPKDEALVYFPEEYSIDCSQRMGESYSGVLFNDILVEVDDTGSIVGLSGFFPHTSWVNKQLDLPRFVYKKMAIVYPFKAGVYPRFNEGGLWKVQVDYKNNLICLGDPHTSGEAICFYPGAVFILCDELPVALWLTSVRGVSSLQPNQALN